MSDLFNWIFAAIFITVFVVLVYVVLPVSIGYFAHKGGWVSIVIIVVFFVLGAALSRGGFTV